MAPGNGGTADIAENVADRCDRRGGGRHGSPPSVRWIWSIIGPDAAAAAGVADACHARGILVFGPTAAAARIESSKTFAKQVMDAAGIPTARWVTGDAADRGRLSAFVAELGGACVVKADGLALGQGRLVCGTVDEAERALDDCLSDERFGDAGRQVVVEELLNGPEVSVFGLSDGRNVRLLVPARDYKRIFDGDRGANTGGMGAIAPPPDAASEDFLEDVARSVLEPCIEALQRAGHSIRRLPLRGADAHASRDCACSSSTPVSAIRRPRWCCRCSVSRSSTCSPRAPRAKLWPGPRRSLMGPPSAWWRPPPGTPATCVAATRSPGSMRSTTTWSVFTREPGATLTGRCEPRAAACSASPRSRADVEAARARAYGNLARVHFDGMQSRSDIGRPAAAGVPS